jgi:predicted O-methyltransferase YrrM
MSATKEYYHDEIEKGLRILNEPNNMNITTRENFGKLAQTFYKKGIGAEIGVEYGSFSNRILQDWTGSLISVDMWADISIEIHARKVLSTSRSILKKMASVDAAMGVENESLDFVYIDADHDYEHCKQDIEAWFSKVRHGGLVAGHDYLDWTVDQGAPANFGVKQAVTEFCVKNGYELHVTSEDFFEGVPYQTWYFTKEMPRIIYYTWVSPDPLPERFEKYITAWKAIMPGYDIRQISLENVVKTPFVMDAIKRNLFSVAGHYGRCERLLATGGIYFDIDIEAVQKFDDLLLEEFFVGCEAAHRVNNAVIGSKPGHPFLKDCLAYMDRIVFHDPGPQGIEIETGPQMFTNLAKERGWVEKNETQRLADMTVFNSKYFYPYYFNEKYNPGCATEETYAVHHWAKTW